jgi:heptosyltransferase-2
VTGGVARLVIRPPNWLGDAVLALPAMAAVRRQFPDAALTVAATGAVAALFREDTDVRPDVVTTLPQAHREVVQTLREGRFDLGVLFPNSFRSAWQLRRAGVPERWGHATAARGWLLTRRPERRRHTGPRRHHLDYYRDLARGLGLPVDESLPRVAASAAARRQASALLGVPDGEAPDAGRIVTLAPGAAYGQAKQWPPARVAALVAKLVQEQDAVCVLVGAAHDREAGRVIERWLRDHAPDAAPRVRNVIGRTDLGVLIGIAARSRVCVTNDSGVMHVAAATGRPVVAIFGPTDEQVTRPVGLAGRADVLTADVFCRPCHLRDCPIDHRCMTRVTVDRVHAAVAHHLEEGSTP